MRRLKTKTVLMAKQIESSRWRHKLKSRYMHEGVPYYAQWQSRELVEKIIDKEIEAKDDPRWKESGAESQAEYTSWTWSCCGMACLKMILADTQHKVVPLVELGKRCMAYGGYKLPLEDSPGLFYKPFVKFVKQEFGLSAKAVAALTIPEIKRTLGGGGYAIVSVTPEIRHPAKEPTKRGGHLVLIVGYDDEKQAFYLHNPSGFERTQENVEVPYKNFAKFFDNKGILVSASDLAAQ
jgi:hypothetical protein